MISTKDIGLFFGARKLFDNVNVKFVKGNCYGIIGANGAGKSTFLKILANELPPTHGQVFYTPGESMAVLKQDHFQYENETVLQTVVMGHDKLFDIMQKKDAIYQKPDFSESDGAIAAELEADFASLGGWEIETDVATLLSGLGLEDDVQNKLVKELKDSDKIKVLLAQTLFAKPDYLLL